MTAVEQIMALTRKCEHLSDPRDLPERFPSRRIDYLVAGDSLNWEDIFVYKRECEQYLVPIPLLPEYGIPRHAVMTRIISNQKMTPVEFEAEYQSIAELISR